MKNKTNGLSCRTVMVAVVLGGLLLLVGCRSNPATACHPGMQTAKLFVQLPSYCPTPDGLAIAPDGDLVVACPNYADQSQKACLIRIGRDHRVRKSDAP